MDDDDNNNNNGLKLRCFMPLKIMKKSGAS